MGMSGLSVTLFVSIRSRTVSELGIETPVRMHGKDLALPSDNIADRAEIRCAQPQVHNQMYLMPLGFLGTASTGILPDLHCVVYIAPRVVPRRARPTTMRDSRSKPGASRNRGTGIALATDRPEDAGR